MKRLPGIWLVVLAGCAACGAPEGRELARTAQPIIGGAADAGHPAVCVVLAGDYVCSATLIGRRVVLTAAHCFDGVDAGEARVYFGPEVFGPDGLRGGLVSRAAGEVFVHPGWEPEGKRAHDLALVRLRRRAPADLAPIPPLASAAGISRDDVGAPMILLGYGLTASGDSSSSGKRMAVEAPLRWLCTYPGGCKEPVDGMWADLPENSICFDYSSGGTCFGDSGGPALVVRQGIEYVAGVGSVGGQECAHYHCSAMVDPAEEFIQGIAASDGTMCSSADQCLSDHCDDGLCAPDPGGDGCTTGSGGGSCFLALLLLVLVYPRRARFML